MLLLLDFLIVPLKQRMMETKEVASFSNAICYVIYLQVLLEKLSLLCCNYLLYSLEMADLDGRSYQELLMLDTLVQNMAR